MTQLINRPTDATSSDSWRVRAPNQESCEPFSPVTESSGEQISTLLEELAAVRAYLEHQRDIERQLYTALESRDSIGQAKGILMERYRISASAAFEVLQRESSRSNRKLVDVAQCLLYSGEDIEVEC